MKEIFKMENGLSISIFEIVSSQKMSNTALLRTKIEICFYRFWGILWPNFYVHFEKFNFSSAQKRKTNYVLFEILILFLGELKFLLCCSGLKTYAKNWKQYKILVTLGFKGKNISTLLKIHFAPSVYFQKSVFFILCRTFFKNKNIRKKQSQIWKSKKLPQLEHAMVNLLELNWGQWLG